MDNAKLVEFLKGTLDPNQRAAAEEQLKQVSSTSFLRRLVFNYFFVPTLHLSFDF